MNECGNCRFYRGDADSAKGHCHRHAPHPGSYLEFYALELLRDIAWSQHMAAGIDPPREGDDLRTEATEAMLDVYWPDVSAADWCGEWETRP